MNVELDGTNLLIFEDGVILTINEKGEIYERRQSMRSNYLSLLIQKNYKQRRISTHRLMGLAFLGLDINNPKMCIDHQDRDTLNNNINNLRIVSQQQNNFNRRDVKGFTKVKNKFKASIVLNGKSYNLGLYSTRELAHNAYLQAKQIYHLI